MASPSPHAAASSSSPPSVSPSKPSSSPPSQAKKAAEDKEEHESIEEIKKIHAEPLAAVRALLSIPCDDDVTVYRFLRGHKMNVSVAAQHLNATLKWRQENKLDAIRAKAEKLTQRQFPFAEKVLAVHPHNIFHGYDRRGQPLSIERLGRANPHQMCRTVPFADMQVYHFHHMESKAALLDRLSLERGEVVRTCKIMDFSGLGRAHLDRRGMVYVKKLLDLSQGNYPEMLGTLFVVNTPWVFTFAWKIVKPWLNEKTLAKIHILPNDGYIDVLKQYIDEENIPDFLGGKCTCAEHGGCVPLKDPNEGMTNVCVPARGSYKHVIDIDPTKFQAILSGTNNAAAAGQVTQKTEGEAEPAAAANSSSSSSSSGSSSSGSNTVGSVCVAYEFHTESNDLALEVIAEPYTSDGKPGPSSVLRASKRYASDQEPILGVLSIDAPTRLTFNFDNSFSYFTSKSLWFRIDIDAKKETATADEDEEDVRKQMAGLDVNAMQSPPTPAVK